MAVQPLTFIIQSTDIERVHYALMMAASNAALGGAVTLFFAIGTADILKPSGAGQQDGFHFAKQLEASGIASIDDLLEALTELECRIAVCDAALAFAAIEAGDLRSDIAIEVTGLTDILANLAGGQIIYV
jgi:peroxiredoxin family protein